MAAAPRPKAPTVPRKQLNHYLALALGHFQTGHEKRADAAARQMIDKLRAVGVLSEGKA